MSPLTVSPVQCQVQTGDVVGGGGGEGGGVVVACRRVNPVHVPGPGGVT